MKKHLTIVNYLKTFRISSGMGSRKREAFTLIELLVSIAIFVVFLGIAGQSYVTIVRAQRQANEVRKMYSDVRVLMDFLSEEIRLSAIDYDCYNQDQEKFFESTTLFDCSVIDVNGSLQGGRSDYLALVRKGGQEKTIVWVEETPEGSNLRVRKRIRSNGVWQDAPGFNAQGAGLLSGRIDIENLSFAIFPDVNPYSADNLPGTEIPIYRDNAVQFQPKVTVFLSVQNAENVTTEFGGDFQTTVSSRVYSRKI